MAFNHVPGTSAIASNLEPFKTNAEDLVNERFEYALNYADKAFQDALQVFEYIKQLAGDIGSIPINLELEDFNFPLTDFSTYDIPDPSDYGISLEQIHTPTLQFNWNDESIYSSDLLDVLKEKCLTDINNGTGISSSVETDIINRETERDILINETAKTNIATDFAEFGWTMPDGVLAYNLAQIETEYQNKRLDKSRDIRIESFNLAQKNIHHAMDTATNIEASLMKCWSDIATRKLEAAKALVDSAIQIFKAQVEFLISKTKIYESVIEAYKARIGLEAEEAKVITVITEAKVRQMLGKASLIIEQAKLLVTQYIEKNKLRLAAMEEAGKIASTVAAGALTGISAQAHVSSSDSFSASGAVSYVGQETKYEDETTT